MEQQTQKSTKAKVDAANAEMPEFMLTKTGVVLLGADLLGDKLAALVCEMLKDRNDSGVALLEFRTDNWPQETDGPVFGMAYADCHAAAINLEHCWHRACSVAAKGEEKLSFMAILWINILSAVGHEIDHLDASNRDRERYELMRMDEKDVKVLEECADEGAIKSIVHLCRNFDTEIPAADEFGWFGSKLMTLFTTDSTKDLDWVKLCREHIEKGIVYDEGEDKQCFTFRDFIKKAHAAKEDNWEQTTTALVLTELLDLGETVVVAAAEPVVAPVVDVVEKAEEAAVEMTQNTNGMFVGAGTTVGNEGPDVIMAEEGDATTSMVAAAAQVMAGGEALVAEVPLPTAVAAEQATMTAAAATAVPPATATPTTYTPCALDQSLWPQVMENVWKTLYHHVFTKCGWSQNPQTGRFFFANPAAVLEGVNIQHIIQQFGADGFIMEYDTMNAQGQYAAEGCQGMIRGYLTSKQGLPAYAIYLNINGMRIKRSFLPQNPEKMNAQNAYTNAATEAQQGHMVAWVFKDEVADAAPFKEKCAVKIRDNAYEVIS